MRCASNEPPACDWPVQGPLSDVTAGAGAFVATSFTAVVLGVARRGDRAVAKQQLLPKSETLRPTSESNGPARFNDHWLAVQAYEGSLRAMESGDPTALFAALCAKETVAELAEATSRRLAHG